MAMRDLGAEGGSGRGEGEVFHRCDGGPCSQCYNAELMMAGGEGDDGGTTEVAIHISSSTAFFATFSFARHVALT